MTPEQRKRKIDSLYRADQTMLEKKGNDYAPGEDCLTNLREFGFMGVVVRLTDKFSRLKCFVREGHLMVKDETIRDTLSDARNYLFLAEILLDEEQKKIGLEKKEG